MSGEMCVAGGEGLVGTVEHLRHRRSSPLVPPRWEGRREESGIARLKNEGKY